MNDQKTEKKDPIFKPGTDGFKVMDDLRALTNETSRSHGTHLFLSERWGKAVVNIIPYPETNDTIAKMYLHSPQEIQNGDCLIRSSKNGAQTNMVFDVQRHDNPSDLYEVHVMQYSPEIGIGHKSPDNLNPYGDYIPGI